MCDVRDRKGLKCKLTGLPPNSPPSTTHTADPSVEISGGSIKVPEAPGFLSASASGSAALESTSGAVEPSSSGELPSTPDIVDWVYEYIVVEGDNTSASMSCHRLSSTSSELDQSWCRGGEEGGGGGCEGLPQWVTNHFKHWR